MEELRTLNTTILFLKRNNQVLLGQKKRGFALGKFIGIGGKQDNGETIDEAMIRESQEEIGIKPIEFERTGIIYFNTFYKGEHVNLVLNIYVSSKFEGEPVETDEIKPIWFEENNIPYSQMLEDDILWMSDVINGNKVTGEVVFDENLKMLSNSIRVCDENEFQNIMCSQQK